jgi:hypothetical protein
MRARTRRLWAWGQSGECVRSRPHQYGRSAAERESAGRHSNGAARCRARHPQQAQRHRSERCSSSGAVGALEERDRPAACLRDHCALGTGEAHRGVRPGRRPASGQEVAAGLFGVALQGIAVAQRCRAPGLRCLAQELRNDVPSRTRSACGSGDFEQPVEREEVGRAVGRPAK